MDNSRKLDLTGLINRQHLVNVDLQEQTKEKLDESLYNDKEIKSDLQQLKENNEDILKAIEQQNKQTSKYYIANIENATFS